MSSPQTQLPPREASEGGKIWEREVKAGKLTGWSKRELAPRVLSNRYEPASSTSVRGGGRMIHR